MSVVQRHPFNARSLRYLRLLFSFLVSLLLVVSSIGTLPVKAQFSLPSTSQEAPPAGVERIGLIEVTSLRFNGEPIFKIASPTVTKRDDPNDSIPVEVRAREVEATLNRLIAVEPESELATTRPYATFLDPKSVKVITEFINEQPVLLVRDNYLSQPETIITVTDADARYYFSTKQEVANRWQSILQDEFEEALAMRQPEALRQQVETALTKFLIYGLITLLLLGVMRFLTWRKHSLEREQDLVEEQIRAQEERVTQSDLASVSDTLLKQQFVLKLRCQLVGIFRWLFNSSLAFLWLIGIGVILRLFPATRRFSYWTNAPIVLLIFLFVAGLVDRIGNLLIDRVVIAWRRGEFWVSEIERGDGHRERRIVTVTSVAKWLKTALIYTFAVLWALQALGISTGSVLAIGAVFALAVSFASQSLVKDLVNGFLILLEDQYAVGDVVEIDKATGMVENLNLRITQLRNAEGRLITIPNSQIIKVENLTRNWSRVDFAIEVAYETDVDRALALLKDQAIALYNDPQWRSLMPEAPEVLGVDGITHQGVLIRVWLKTLPLQQWKVGREFRRRIKVAFDQNKIHIGVPQQSLYSPDGALSLTTYEDGHHSEPLLPQQHDRSS